MDSLKGGSLRDLKAQLSNAKSRKWYHAGLEENGALEAAAKVAEYGSSAYKKALKEERKTRKKARTWK